MTSSQVIDGRVHATLSLVQQQNSRISLSPGNRTGSITRLSLQAPGQEREQGRNIKETFTAPRVGEKSILPEPPSPDSQEPGFPQNFLKEKKNIARLKFRQVQGPGPRSFQVPMRSLSWVQDLSGETQRLMETQGLPYQN